MYTYWYHFVIQTIHTSEQQSAFAQDYKCTIQPGNEAIGTDPAYLRPFALLAYICGFTSDSSSDLRFHTENKWKEKQDFLISQGDNDVKSWVLYCGNQVISDVCDNNDVRFSVERNEN